MLRGWVMLPVEAGADVAVGYRFAVAMQARVFPLYGLRRVFDAMRG